MKKFFRLYDGPVFAVGIFVMLIVAYVALASLTSSPPAHAQSQPVPAPTVWVRANPVVLVTLDVKTVATGGTAVTALAAGHRNFGGWIQNPSTATTTLCINEIGTAVGTTSSGDTTCIAAGQIYQLSSSPNAVSVIASDTHPFSGYGWN